MRIMVIKILMFHFKFCRLKLFIHLKIFLMKVQLSGETAAVSGGGQLSCRRQQAVRGDRGDEDGDHPLHQGVWHVSN